MQAERQIKWLYLDLNSYFASVEQQDNPALRGKPVAVVPAHTDYTCAIAASYEAKRFGVKTGTQIKEAKRLCPGLHCVLARHDAYVRYHNLILEEVVRHTPIARVCSIDELSSRIPPGKRDEASAIKTAARIKEGLHKNVGEVINCSIGVAANSLLAKIASDMQKPDGLTILHPEKMPGPLFDLALTDLPGINTRMEARLREGRVTSVEAFYNLAPKQARQIWGSVTGERFWYLLHGYDLPDQETSRSSIGHSRVLDPELRSPDAALQVARRLTIKAAARLRHQQFFATRFAFGARAEDNRWDGEVNVPPAQDNFTFLTALGGLWSAMMDDLQPRKLKKVSVTLSGLCREADITRDLFDAVSPVAQRAAQRKDALSETMDFLNGKYGAETLRLGVSPRTSAGFVGTKIAFARVPDISEFKN